VIDGSQPEQRQGVARAVLLMPGMSGLAFCRQIRLQPKLAKVPVVILSASGGKPRTLRLRSGRSGRGDPPSVDQEDRADRDATPDP